MEGNRLLLTDFTSDEGFELTRYIAHLFEYVSSLHENNNIQFKPAQE